jgi:hypothetical protein
MESVSWTNIARDIDTQSDNQLGLGFGVGGWGSRPALTRASSPARNVGWFGVIVITVAILPKTENRS